ncbi:YCF48-related protein [Fidelibacter multiformis]|uniref:YCF48-related protein n=1 Tax=Fidelibacter multiformis TaxID=3377529 RepID=UPI0037DC909A
MRKVLTLVAVLLSATLLMGQTWEIVREQSISFDPADVYFHDAQNGVLVGDEGAIYSTTDGAKTLTPVIAADPAVPDLVDVHFADANNGYAVGDDGLILKTTDGGSNWIDVSDTNVVVDLAGVAVISDQVAYVAGDDSTLLKTTDGGANWIRSTFNFANADLDGGIAFYDADHGVVLSDANGGDAWYTTDGGDTWNYSPLAGYFPVGTTSSRLYDIDAAGTTFVVVGYHRTTFISTDNGQTWTLSGPFSYDYDRNISVDAIDDNTFYVGGNGGWFLKTSDAGATWDTLYFNTGNDADLVHFVNADEGFVFGNYAQWMATSDGGATFEPINEWPSSSFWGLALPTDTKVIVTDWSGGDMTVSEDLGFTWSYPSNAVTQTVVSIYEIEFADENTGLLAGSDGLVKKTTDGGQTFTFVDNPMAQMSRKHINALRYVDENTVLAGGSSGIIMKSTDGGDTWVEIGSEGSSTVYDFWPVSPDLTLASVGSGQILYADADLDTFYLARDYGSMSMRSVESRNGVLLIGASSGEIYRTTDFNALDSLEAVYTDPDGNDIYDLEFVTDDLVYAVGRRGRIYKSEDAGLTWVQDVSGVEASEPTLQKCAYRNNVLWAVGQNGVILKLDMTPEEPVTGIVINEILANNVEAADENFIEFYNTNAEAVDIGGLYLSTDSESPLEWQIPDTDPTATTIPGGGYLVMWADNLPTEGTLHAGVLLDAAGGYIGLVQNLNDTPTVVDSYTYEAQSPDTAVGRYPDGTDTWQDMPATPGAANEEFPPVSVVDGLPKTFAVHANYPNPFNPETTIRFDLPERMNVTVHVYNILGELVKTLVNNTQMPAGYHSIRWNGTNQMGMSVASGIYLYHVEAGTHQSTHRMVLLK